MAKLGWVAIPVGLIHDRRICEIGGHAAIAGMIAAYAHAGAHETDGFVPRAVVETVAGAAVVAALIAGGMLRAVAGGLEIADYLAVNPTRAQREAARGALAERQRQWRERRRNAKCNAVTNAVTNGVTNGVTNAGRERQRQLQETVRGTGSPEGASATPPRDEIAPESSADRTPIDLDPAADRSASGGETEPAACGALQRVEPSGKGKGRQRRSDAQGDGPPAQRKPTEAQRAWNHYRDRFGAATGARPTALERYFVALDRLVREHGADEIIRRVDVYFDAPPFSLRDGARDFGLFLRCFDRLAAPSAPAASGSATPRGLVSDPNSFLRIGATPAAKPGGTSDVIPRLFAPHPRDERSGLPAPDAERR